jgi:hypothetical protein
MAVLRLSWRPRRLAAAAVALALLGPAWGRAAAPEYGEYDVKAAFLYNFAKFVEWPADAFIGEREPITLCILGDDPFGESLEAMVRGETVGGRQILIDRTRRRGELRSCHILFVSRSESQRLPQVLAELRGASVLTVGDTPGFLEAGVLINFTLQDHKVRFGINPRAAERSRLKISSKLLRLAINQREGLG